ncbi:hypothetical protein KDH_37330 [Dictyobacter sp. S3.2.2.5]|uniref:Uncharacterized protein n=1 Tax=Dictyobacter halimunensis TaxID=3026934 RepID=A0ABQ6FRK5_9CHLR|nr:hypothetical protein KDH_37330 [Dictyobacter sp. S3.2.2.5]
MHQLLKNKGGRVCGRPKGGAQLSVGAGIRYPACIHSASSDYDIVRSTKQAELG